MSKFDIKHDRYPFSALPKRATYEWPNGSRLAVYIALNVEAFEFGRNPGPDFTTLPTAPFARGFAYRDFGNRVGLWRLVDLFDEFKMPITLLANTSVYDAFPEILEPFRDRGDEFVGHGRTNSERQIDMEESAERAMIAEVTARFKKEEGKAPKGWLGPFISQSPKTPEILIENGYSYMMDWYFDEQPQWFRTDKGPILAVPYPSMEMNDIPAFINRGLTDAAFEQMLIDCFEEMLLASRKAPLVYALSLHTFLMGQPHRIRLLRRVLERITREGDGVWLATAGQIAEHVSRLPDGIVTKP